MNTNRNFRGSKLQLFIDNWEQITSNKTILSWVRGVHIDFDPTSQKIFVPKQCSWGKEKMNM